MVFIILVGYGLSGLGVSGISRDMRTLLMSREPRAELAVELFLYRIRRELGSLAAALGGLDAIVFTGRIGKMPRSFAAVSGAMPPGWGWRSMKRPTPQAEGASAKAQAASPFGSSRRTKN